MALLAPKDHGGLFPLSGPELAALLGLVPAGAPGEPGPAAAFGSVLALRGRAPVARRGGLFSEERPAWSYPSYPAILPTDGVLAGHPTIEPEPEKWSMKVTEYPDGGAEASVCQLGPPRLVPVPVRSWEQAPARPGPRPRSDADLIRDNRAKDRRAASRVRRIGRQNELSMLFSLTWPAPGQHSREKAIQTATAFIEKFPEVTGGGPWVLVAELHPGGHGYHIHILTGVKYYPGRILTKIRTDWTGFLVRRGWTLPAGVGSVRVNARPFHSAKRAAAYAAKYVAKSIGGAERKRGTWRYSLSRGLKLITASRRVGAWWHVFRAGRGRVPVAWWRSWVEGQEPAAWPVAWCAFEVPAGARAP